MSVGRGCDGDRISGSGPAARDVLAAGASLGTRIVGSRCAPGRSVQSRPVGEGGGVGRGCVGAVLASPFTPCDVPVLAMGVSDGAWRGGCAVGGAERFAGSGCVCALCGDRAGDTGPNDRTCCVVGVGCAPRAGTPGVWGACCDWDDAMAGWAGAAGCLPIGRLNGGADRALRRPLISIRSSAICAFRRLVAVLRRIMAFAAMTIDMLASATRDAVEAGNSAARCRRPPIAPQMIANATSMMVSVAPPVSGRGGSVLWVVSVMARLAIR